MNRRTLFAAGAATLALAACATTGGGAPSFATIQAYVADAAATFDKLVPLIGEIAPATIAELQKIQTSADAAAAAFGKLTAPTAAGVAQQVLTYIGDGLAIVEAVPGLPAPYLAAIAAAQVLLVAISGYFNLGPSASPARVTPAEAAAADAQLHAFLAS